MQDPRQGSTTWPEHLRPFAEAHSNYEQARRQSATDDRRAMEKATLDYWTALHAAQSDAQKIREAYDQYQAALERERQGALERRKASYRDFITALQSSFAGAEADRYDAAALYMIGSSLQAVASDYEWIDWCARAGQPNTQQTKPQ